MAGQRMVTGGGGSVGDKSPASSPRAGRKKSSAGRATERWLYGALAVVLRRRGWLLAAPLLYVTAMLMLSWDLEGVPGRVGVSVLRRQPPGSLYRSPQLFQKLWPFMQADVNHSNAMTTAWHYKASHKWKPCYRKKLSQAGLPPSNGFLIIEANGGLNQQRLSCNPIIRWHVLQGSINAISFSTNGSYLAIVGRDGYLRVFDYHKEELLFGGKSYSGALLCCAWSHDDKYILTGGEDDLVHVWSTEARKMVSYGEEHNSWVTDISFDPYWLAPNSNRIEENDVYRFGSVGEDGRILMWNLEIDKLFEPVQDCDFPTLIEESTSRDATTPPLSTLHPSPRLQQLPQLSPVGGGKRGRVDPLSTLIFEEDFLFVMSRGGGVKIWSRPGGAEISHAS